MPKIQAAKTFGVGISFIKCYVATYRKGGALAPKKRSGSKPKLDESARKLLEANLEDHPEHHPEHCATRESVSAVDTSP
jgi:transposase